tara:strand:+ start:5049 stop:5243 length:195 start_codon:yes stop_codon:yes gene_type:complete
MRMLKSVVMLLLLLREVKVGPSLLLAIPLKDGLTRVEVVGEWLGVILRTLKFILPGIYLERNKY